MLRHGTTEANEQRRFTGGADVPLSENGRLALLPLAGAYPKAERFFTSGMRRAVETLAILYGEVPHTDIPDLGEYRFGAFEMRTHEELYEAEPLYRQWLAPGARDIVCPGGESRRMFAERVTQGFRKLAGYEWEGLAVLITHGGVVRTVMQEIAGCGEVHQPVRNAEGYMVWLNPGGRIARYEAYP